MNTLSNEITNHACAYTISHPFAKVRILLYKLKAFFYNFLEGFEKRKLVAELFLP